MRMLMGVANCARTPPMLFPVDPLPWWVSRSIPSTSRHPASVRWYAMLEPTIPPPMMITSAEIKMLVPQSDRIRLRDSTKLAGKCLFGILGGRVGRKRVDDFLPLRGRAGPRLLQHPEGPQRPCRAGGAQNLVQKELAVGGLKRPCLAAV